MQVNGMVDCNIGIGQEVIIPGADQQVATSTPIPLDQYTVGQVVAYTVEMNDSYNDIAAKFNTTLDSIQRMNNVNVYTTFPRYGQVLQIEVNLVTPTPHVNGILRALDMARNDGLSLPIVYNTNGYLSVYTVDKLKNHVDIWLPDFKYHDQRLADRFSSAPHYFETALTAIGRMLEVSGQLDLDESGRAKKGVLIRHLVLPACVFDTRDVLSAIKTHFGTDTYLSLMHQFTPQPDGKAPLNRRLTKREYESAVTACLDMGFTRVYIQDALSATFAYTPDFSDKVSVQS